MTELMNKYENELFSKGYDLIAGLDEVGRGAMAGPVVVASVILDKNNPIDGLNDSKKLSKKDRNRLYDEIISKCIDYTFVFIDSKRVDELNVYQASKVGMLECLTKLKKYDYALSDAMPLGNSIKHTSIIKGDSKSISIAAASIVAKVLRDNYMEELHEKYPSYGFNTHVGYCTKKHKDAIKEFGLIEEHRLTFAPIKELLNETEQLRFDL